MRKLAIVFLLLTIAGCETYSPPELTATARVVTVTPWNSNTPTANDPTATAATEDPTPTQVVNQDPFCYKVPTEAEGFVTLNPNNCLKFPEQGWVSPGAFQAEVEQWLPSVGGYMHYNWPRSIEGNNPHCHIPPIPWDDTGYVIDIGKTCGYFGWAQPVETDDAGCHAIKVTGYADISEHDDEGNSTWPEPNAYNYGIFATVVRSGGDGETLPVIALTENGYFEAFMTVFLGIPGDYLIRFGVFPAYAAADVGSTIRIETFSFVWDEDGDHCHANTPEV